MLTEKARKALRGLDFRHKKRPQLRSIYILLVPKAGLEPARIATVDFESTASTGFATSALKGLRKTGELYPSPLVTQLNSFHALAEC